MPTPSPALAPVESPADFGEGVAITGGADAAMVATGVALVDMVVGVVVAVDATWLRGKP